MMIREALLSDLDGITACARRFFDYAQYAESGLPLDEDSFMEMVAHYIQDEKGIVFLLMDGLTVAGGVAGYIMPWGFNRSFKFCYELFYWVDEQYRGVNSLKLLKKYENKAKSLGVYQNVMICPNTYLFEKVKKLYERMGYRAYEQQFLKAL